MATPATKQLWWVIVTGLAIVASACTSAVTPTASPTTTEPTTTEPTTTEPTTAAPTTTTVPTTTTTEAPDPVELALAALTTEQKVGQLIMPVVDGTAADTPARRNLALGGAETPAELVRALHLGGVLYLGPNIVDAAQLSAFSTGLQASSDAGIGLLIAIDQEGGRVQRITDGVTPIPSARSLEGDTASAEAIGLQSALELRAQGINVVFAPVADITAGNAGVIANRSYSDDPTVVANMVVATINGLQRGGVAATVKHWPGHGDTTVDSHQSLPVIDIPLDIWTNRERVPFAAAVGAGVEMVMVGHLAMPQLDPSNVSATQSPILVNDLLRDGLGFDGVVVSDALDMGALDGVDRGEVAVQSIEAGIDILLAPPDIAAVQASILAALDSGRLTSERIDESVRRILTLKLRLGLLADQP